MRGKGGLLRGLVLIVAVAGIFYVYSHRKSQPKTIEDVITASMSPTPTPEESATPIPSPTPMLPKAALKLSPKDQRKIVVLMQILESKNDNDPRMDTDLKNLSPEVKRAMESYYGEIEREKRNDRGTIVFLIGRQITEKSDVDFLKSVMMEKPCLSLSDCSKTVTQSPGGAHLEGINETTANYPQIMAIRQAVAQYREILGNSEIDQSLAQRILQTLRDTAHSSPNPKAVNDAEQALRYLTGHK